MKSIKILLYALAIIVGLALIIAAFIPSDVTISRSTSIAAKPDLVFYQVANLKNWENWSPFEDKDMTSVYAGSFAAPGMTRDWKSVSKGDGHMEIVSVVPNSEINSSMYMLNGNHGTEHWTFNSDSTGQTVVTWAFTFSGLKYPLQRFLGIVAESVMGPVFEQGLAQLKTRCDSLGYINGMQLVEFGPFIYESILDTLSLEAMNAEIGGMYTEIFGHIMKNNVLPAGPSIAIYHQWDPEGDIVFEAGLPVSEFKPAGGRILQKEFMQTKTIKYTYVGDYESLETPHNLIQKYIDACGFTISGSPVEEYVVTPEQETDKTKWVTNIYYPVL